MAALTDMDWSRLVAAVGRLADAAGGDDVSFLLDCMEKLHDEVQDARLTVSVIVAACGGQVRVPEKLFVDPPKMLHRRDDIVSGQVVFDAE